MQKVTLHCIIACLTLAPVFAPSSSRGATPPAYAHEGWGGYAAALPLKASGPSAVEAYFHLIDGVAADNGGNLYFAVPNANRVYRLRPDGSYDTFAGNGLPGVTEDNRLATETYLDTPTSVATDASGNVYIGTSNRVVKVTADGILRVIAGGGIPGSSGEGQPATKASIQDVVAVVVDNNGNVYFAASDKNRVCRISASGGILTTVAGGSYGDSGDGGPAVNAGFDMIRDLAIDASGALYVVGYDTIRKFTPGGNITTVLNGYVQMSGLPAGAKFGITLAGATVDPQGNIYFTNYSDFSVSHFIARCNQSKSCTVIAGSGVSDEKMFGRRGFSGDGGPATSARIARAGKITRDNAGNLYFSDYKRLRKISPSNVISTLAGTTNAALLGEGKHVSQIQLFQASSVAVDRQDNVYIADDLGYRIWKVSSGGTATVLAGTGTPGYSGDGGPATAADIGSPAAIAADPSGNIYFSDPQAQRVRVVRPNGIIETFAGMDWEYCMPSMNAGKPARQICLLGPAYLATDSVGNLYLGGDSLPYKITPAGMTHSLESQFGAEVGPVAVDGQDNVYYAVGGGRAEIRKMTSGGAVVKIAGTGTSGSSGDEGPANSAQVNVLCMAADRDGNLFLGELSADRIRMIDSSGVIHWIGGRADAPNHHRSYGLPAKNVIIDVAGIAVDSRGNVYLGEGFSINWSSAVSRLEPGIICRRCITNAANYAGGRVAAGELFTLFPMSAFGPPSVVEAQLEKGAKRYPTQIANTRVLFDGVAAPLIYVSANQLSGAVPYSVAGKQSVQVVIEHNGQQTPPATVDVVAAVPGLFTLNQSGKGQAAALNWPSYSVNGPANKISKGGTVMLYGTAGGGTGQDGTVVSGIERYPGSVEVWIDNQWASVSYAGSAPDLISGVLQVNVEVPKAASSGNCVPVVLVVRGRRSDEDLAWNEYACLAIQ
jgi:uncharacterized protein (TIGR03437 family)